MTKQTDIIELPQSPTLNVEALIIEGIRKGLSVDSMRELLAMRTQLMKENAKKEYDHAMALFQAECPTIEKTKGVKTNSGKLAYLYAPIDSIINQVKPILQKYGFSYSSNMEFLENGVTKVKVVIKITHAGGHSELTEMTVPLGTKTDIMSQTQVVAAAQTFAKRYAFCNALGILTGDEDTDALPPQGKAAETKYLHSDFIKQINATVDIDGLIKVCQAIKKKLTMDMYQPLNREYTRRKKEIEDGEGQTIADEVSEAIG